MGGHKLTNKIKKWQCIHCGSKKIETITRPLSNEPDLVEVERVICEDCEREIKQIIYYATCSKCNKPTLLLFTTKKKFKKFIKDVEKNKWTQKCIHCKGDLSSVENIIGSIFLRAGSCVEGTRSLETVFSWY